MSKTIDPRDIKWFGPLWRRVALVAVLVVWTGIEWLNADQFWGVMTLLVLGYAIWKLFIDFPSPAEIAAFEKAEAEKASKAAAAREADAADEETEVPVETESPAETTDENADPKER